MFVNINDQSLPITVSVTPTAYAIPDGVVRFRIFNDSGATVTIKEEASSTVTLTAPVSGTKQNATTMGNGSTELFSANPTMTFISVYSATGTGLIHIQFTYGQ